jgi:hypothetical protein
MMRESLEGTGAARGASLGSRQWLSVAGLCLAALLLIATALWWGSGSDVDGVPAAVEADEDPVETEEDVDEAETDVVDELSTVTYEIYLARDPFEPVRTPPAEAVADDDDTIVIDPDDDTIVTDPDDPDDPDAPARPAPSDPSQPSDPAPPDPGARCVGGEDEVVCNGQVISLLDITTVDGEEVAVLQVDTTVYEVRQGERFAEHHQLMRVDRDAGRVDSDFIVGDTRQSYTLRVDTSTLK